MFEGRCQPSQWGGWGQCGLHTEVPAGAMPCPGVQGPHPRLGPWGACSLARWVGQREWVLFAKHRMLCRWSARSYRGSGKPLAPEGMNDCMEEGAAAHRCHEGLLKASWGGRQRGLERSGSGERMGKRTESAGVEMGGAGGGEPPEALRDRKDPGVALCTKRGRFCARWVSGVNNTF